MKNLLFLISLLLMPAAAFAQLNCSGGEFGCLGLTNGQLPIGRTGNTPVGAALTGTANQVTVANASGSVTLSTPQSINTTSTPQFAQLNIGSTAVTYAGLRFGGGTIPASAAAYGIVFAAGFTLQASANNDELDVIRINPTFDDNGKTGVTHYGLASLTTGSSYFSGNLGLNGTVPLSLLSVNGNGATGYTLYVNSGTSGLNGRVYMGALSTSASVQTDYLCLASTGEVIADTGLCLASSDKIKNWLGDMTCAEATRIVTGLKPGWFQYKNEGRTPERSDWSIHAGFVAEDVEKVEPRLVNYTKEGEPRGVQYEMHTAILTRYLQCLR